MKWIKLELKNFYIYMNIIRNTLINNMNKIPEDDTIYTTYKYMEPISRNVW